MWVMKSATATASGTAMTDREGGREDGAEGERGDVVDEGSCRSGSSEAAAVSAGKPLGDEEDRDPGEQGEDRHRGDDGVLLKIRSPRRRRPPDAAASSWPALVVVSTWATVSR